MMSQIRGPTIESTPSQERREFLQTTLHVSISIARKVRKSGQLWMLTSSMSIPCGGGRATLHVRQAGMAAWITSCFTDFLSACAVVLCPVWLCTTQPRGPQLRHLASLRSKQGAVRQNSRILPAIAGMNGRALRLAKQVAPIATEQEFVHLHSFPVGTATQGKFQRA